LSKAFAFTEKADGSIDHLTSLKDTLASLPDTLLTETESEISSEQAFKERLEVLQQQEELIEDEAEQEQEEEEARKLRKQAELEEKERIKAQQAEAEAAASVEKDKFDSEKEIANELLQPDQAEQAKDQEGRTGSAAEVDDVKMTTEQLTELGEALSILSAKSSVKRERDDLDALMQESKSDEAEAAKELAAEEGDREEKEGRKVTALEKRIQKMITQIDEQLDAYDQEVGDIHTDAARDLAVLKNEEILTPKPIFPLSVFNFVLRRFPTR